MCVCVRVHVCVYACADIAVSYFSYSQDCPSTGNCGNKFYAFLEIKNASTLVWVFRMLNRKFITLGAGITS